MHINLQLISSSQRNNANFIKLWLIILLTGSLCSASNLSWMYKEDPITAGKTYSNNSSGNKFSIDDECLRPIKPKQLNDNRDVNRINEALHTYHNCIINFQRKYTDLYNKEKDPKKRQVIAKALEKSQRDWINFASKDDVEQNQKVLATFESLSLGYEEPKKAPQKE